MTEHLLTPVSVLVALAGAALLALPAFAEPVVTASPDVAADSYIVRGQGFTPGASVTVYDASACGGETHCPNDYSVAKATVGSAGSFSVAVQLAPFQPAAGQTMRALQIAQDDWTPAQLDQAPLVQVPLHHDGVPGAPQTGTGSVPGTAGLQDVELAMGGALLGFFAGLVAVSAWLNRREAD
jgi:hypothetical protein